MSLTKVIKMSQGCINWTLKLFNCLAHILSQQCNQLEECVLYFSSAVLLWLPNLFIRKCRELEAISLILFLNMIPKWNSSVKSYTMTTYLYYISLLCNASLIQASCCRSNELLQKRKGSLLHLEPSSRGQEMLVLFLILPLIWYITMGKFLKKILALILE